MEQQNKWIISLQNVKAQDTLLVGGKGANLGEILDIGIPVPSGFCVTTEAYLYFLNKNSLIDAIKKNLKSIESGVSVKEAANQISQLIISSIMPDDLKNQIDVALDEFTDHSGFAVRSSATSEDSPDTSFAGQLETALNIHGNADVILKIKEGWASLFNERAITYRQTNKISHESSKIAIIIQQMVNSEKSGIMFTADPFTENRNIISIDSGFGLGEALVSGIVTADNYQIDKKNWQITSKKIAKKDVAVSPITNNESGVITTDLEQNKKEISSLSDEELIELAHLGQKIENHYNCPQDIEWAIVDNHIFITQTRPITTLYPLPKPVDDHPHLFLNFNYVQVMMDPIRPLGQSVIRMMTIGDIYEHSEEKSIASPAGGRLYFDITPLLTIKLARKKAPEMISFVIDPPFGQAMQAGIEKLKPQLSEVPSIRKKGLKFFMKLPPIILKGMINILFRNPDKLFEKANNFLDLQVEKYTQELESTQSPLETLFKIEEVLHQVLLKTVISAAPVLLSVILPFNFLGKMLTKKGLNKEMAEITRGLSDNITTQMDLDVASLTDALIKNNDEKDSPEFQQKLSEFLAKYGMRGPSEIDITRDRYSEDPSPLLKIIEGNRQNKKLRSHLEHHKELALKAQEAEIKIVKAYRGLNKLIVKRFIRLYRTMMPFRESPKYMIMRVFYVIKKKLLEIGDIMQKSGWISLQKDIYYLQLSEIQKILEYAPESLNQESLKFQQLIDSRKRDHEHFFNLQAPKFITGEGEIMRGKPMLDNILEGAIVGSSVSVGVVEGIAHVIRDPAKEILSKGEILITKFTDPGWTPLFINAAGLVMEVGGMMTHGSVIAREYGIPAIVGVEKATQLIKTGQKIRVNGDLGTIEFL